MRPTDEDQPGSRRPNLMSSGRRSANEVNILDMLDRQTNGPLPRRMLRNFLKRPARFWYGAAGLLVCGLVGTLAWLAHDGAHSNVDTALAGSIKPVPVPEPDSNMVGNAPLVASVAKPAQAPDAAAPAGATIVDVAPASDSEPAPPAPAAVTPAAPVLADTLPPQQTAGRITSHAVTRDPPRPAAHSAAPRSAPRTSRAAPAHAEQPARSRRQAAAKAAPAPVDTDVALISAIIQHANARQEAEEAARKP